MKKPKLNITGRNRFRFVTPLPVDLAMTRLNSLSELVAPRADLHSEQSYKVSQKRLDDTIYFEVRTLVSYGGETQSYEQIITGQIRELDASRTVVEGEFQRARVAAKASLALTVACALSAFFAWMLATDDIPSATCLALLLLFFAALNFAWPFLLNYRALDRAPTLERI